MKELNITLTKVEKYQLKPFGQFKLKWSCTEGVAKRPNILPLIGISFVREEGMPYNKEQYEGIVAYMKKNKSEVLCDGMNYYTIIGDRFVKLFHNKLNLYKQFLLSRGFDDDETSWKLFKKN